jgi:hypothetical protein
MRTPAVVSQRWRRLVGRPSPRSAPPRRRAAARSRRRTGVGVCLATSPDWQQDWLTLPAALRPPPSRCEHQPRDVQTARVACVRHHHLQLVQAHLEWAHDGEEPHRVEVGLGHAGQRGDAGADGRPAATPVLVPGTARRALTGQPQGQSGMMTQRAWPLSSDPAGLGTAMIASGPCPRCYQFTSACRKSAKSPPGRDFADTWGSSIQ